MKKTVTSLEVLNPRIKACTSSRPLPPLSFSFFLSFTYAMTSSAHHRKNKVGRRHPRNAHGYNRRALFRKRVKRSRSSQRRQIVAVYTLVPFVFFDVVSPTPSAAVRARCSAAIPLEAIKELPIWPYLILCPRRCGIIKRGIIE